MVTNPDVSAVRDADRIIGIIEAEEKGPAQLIINRINPDLIRKGDMLSVDDIVELLSVDLIGIVPEDSEVTQSTNKGVPVVTQTNSKAGKAFRNISKRLSGIDVPLEDLDKKDGILGRLSRIIRPGGN